MTWIKNSLNGNKAIVYIRYLDEASGLEHEYWR